jgi:hypothetical protein
VRVQRLAVTLARRAGMNQTSEGRGWRRCCDRQTGVLEHIL